MVDQVLPKTTDCLLGHPLGFDHFSPVLVAQPPPFYTNAVNRPMLTGGCPPQCHRVLLVVLKIVGNCFFQMSYLSKTLGDIGAETLGDNRPTPLDLNSSPPVLLVQPPPFNVKSAKELELTGGCPPSHRSGPSRSGSDGCQNHSHLPKPC
jgi:hypothetical protein